MLITSGHTCKDRLGQTVTDRTKHDLRVPYFIDYVDYGFPRQTPILDRCHP